MLQNISSPTCQSCNSNKPRVEKVDVIMLVGSVGRKLPVEYPTSIKSLMNPSFIVTEYWEILPCADPETKTPWAKNTVMHNLRSKRAFSKVTKRLCSLLKQRVFFYTGYVDCTACTRIMHISHCFYFAWNGPYHQSKLLRNPRTSQLIEWKEKRFQLRALPNFSGNITCQRIPVNW